MESKALSSVVNIVDESGPASLQEIMKHRKTKKMQTYPEDNNNNNIYDLYSAIYLASLAIHRR